MVSAFCVLCKKLLSSQRDGYILLVIFYNLYFFFTFCIYIYNLHKVDFGV